MANALCILSLFFVCQVISTAPFSFLHVSDVHLDIHYNPTGNYRNRCREIPFVPVTNKTYGYWGKYRCDSPQGLVTSAFKYMSQVANPNFIVMGGDFPAHRLTDSKDVFNSILSVPYVITLGNNDFFPRYSENATMSTWLKPLATAIAPLGVFPTSVAQRDFSEYGYYSITLADFNLRILSLNSVIFSPYYEPYPPPSNQQMDHIKWIVSELAQAKQMQQNVFIIGHVPPTVIVWHNESQWHREWIDAYFNNIMGYEDIIKGQFFTHTHRDAFTFSNLQSKSQAVPILLSPSISPNTDTNPSFRVYIYTNEEVNGRKDLSLLDYLEYYVDFLDPKTLKTGDLNWKLEYGFNAAYNQTRVDAKAMLDLLRRLREDPELYAIWRARCDSLFSPERYAYICSIEYNREEDFLKCLAETNPEP